MGLVGESPQVYTRLVQSHIAFARCAVNNHLPKRIGFCTGSMAVVAFLLVLPGAALAQRTTPKNPSGRETYEATRARERNIRDREMRMQHLDDLIGKQPTKKEQMLALAQIKEDFERMQAVNNNLLREVSIKQALDFKLISEATEEINKLAKRLKSNLVFPETEQNKEDQKKANAVDATNLKVSIQQLDSFVMSFVTNPHFQNLGVLDTENAAKASNDLKAIIELSGNIKKHSEKLSKTSPKP